MSPVVYVVVGGVLDLFALLILVGIALSWARKRNALLAVEHLRKLLDKGARRAGPIEISPIATRPLSIEMTKEAAAMSGYKFLDFYNRNGSELMRFRRTQDSQEVRNV